MCKLPVLGKLVLFKVSKIFNFVQLCQQQYQQHSAESSYILNTSKVLYTDGRVLFSYSSSKRTYSDLDTSYKDSEKLYSDPGTFLGTVVTRASRHRDKST